MHKTTLAITDEEAVQLYRLHGGWDYVGEADESIACEVKAMLAASSDEEAAKVIEDWGCWESPEDRLRDVSAFRRRGPFAWVYGASEYVDRS